MGVKVQVMLVSLASLKGLLPLEQMAPYRASSAMDEAVAALAELRRHKSVVAETEQAWKELSLRRDVMKQHLPKGETPDLSQPIPRPDMDRNQLRAALDQLDANLRGAQSRLDTLAGQIRSMGDPDDLITRRQQKQEQLERLQEEYDAISLAMDALENANLALQNRFSPALGARAAEIFSGITGGKYDRYCWAGISPWRRRRPATPPGAACSC